MTKCIGCGAILQTTEKTQEGYTQNINNKLCSRCFKIRHYNEYEYIDKDNIYYKQILKRIEQEDNLVVLVTDFLNLQHLQTLKIKNDIILVISKRDIIPRNIDETRLLQTIKLNLNIKERLIVGARNNYHLDELYAAINRYKKSERVYIIGYTNAGKSTLINSFIKSYGNNNNYITTSNLPSTTLNLIETRINDNLVMIDTPGLLDEGSIINIHSKLLNKILPKKEIRPINIQIKTPQTIYIDSIARIYISQSNSLIIYMSNSLNITRVYKEVHEKNNLKEYIINIKPKEDLIIKGLGFIRFTKEATIKLYLKEEVDYIVRKSFM